MPPYRILHLIGGGEIGGAEQHVLTLLTHLKQSRFTPYLICLAEGPFAELASQKGIPTETLLMRHPLDLTLLPALSQWIRSHHINLLHTHGSRANLLGRLSARRLGLPCVSTVHSSLHHDYLSPAAATLAITLDRLTLPLAKGIITVSKNLAGEVAKRGGKNIKTIYNGQNPLPTFDPDRAREHFRRHWKIPGDALVLGCIGRLHPTKGHKYLVEAASLLHKTLPKLHLLMIGDGPLKAELEKQLQEAKVPYTLPGYLPDAHKALPAANLFVLPSISEGMGLVLLEAMQARIPIVASAVGGIPEVARNNKEALLVPAADSLALAAACQRLLEDKALTRSLIDSASHRWPLFSVETMVSETEEFYLDILR